MFSNHYSIRVSQKPDPKDEERYGYTFALPWFPGVPETITENCKPEGLVSYPQNTNTIQTICHTPKTKGGNISGVDSMLSIKSNAHSNQSKQPLHYIYLKVYICFKSKLYKCYTYIIWTKETSLRSTPSSPKVIVGYLSNLDLRIQAVWKSA